MFIVCVMLFVYIQPLRPIVSVGAIPGKRTITPLLTHFGGRGD